MLTHGHLAAGRLLPPVRRRALAGLALVGLLLAGCGQIATPRPEPTPVIDASLSKLDGVYAAEITQAVVRRLELPTTMPAGLWKIAIHADSRTIEVSAPEGPDGGGYVLDIASIAPRHLTLGPDRTCEIPSERASPAAVTYSLRHSTLVFTHASGGCAAAWLMLRSTPWLKA